MHTGPPNIAFQRADIRGELGDLPTCPLQRQGVRLTSCSRVRPIVFAVRKSTTSSNVVGCSIVTSAAHWNLLRSAPLARRETECVMDWNRIEGNWKQFKGRAKEKWGRLTDDDLDVINGRQEQLEGKIQERYGLAKDQAKKDVQDWFNSLP
jgi:uncharacterized protein YjbJ (UPF0337 family)